MTLQTPAIQVEGLSKRLRHGLMAVDRLDLEVPRGSVFGLLGPNGSGKTMTMRMLVGLVRPTSGRVFLFGEEVRPGAKVLGRVGALIDGPGFVPHLSGRRNLEIAVRLHRLSGGSADLESAVSMTGLGEAIDRRYSEYSHGMRYRLAVAQATLGSPDLLILDEPTTGMDPAQIRDVRRAIQAVAAEGVTVILASHSIAEIQLLCTHAAVLRSGALLASGSVSDLMGSTPEIIVEVDDTAGAVAALRGLVDCRVSTTTPTAVVVAGRPLALGEVVECLEQASIVVRGARASSLEDAYHVLLESRDGRPPPRPR